jgi:hypothetical protein
VISTQTPWVQPAACRVWEPQKRVFVFSDSFGWSPLQEDRWTGFFDKQGLPLYERDIIQVHFDWKLGWIRGLIERQPENRKYAGRVKGPDGKFFHIGFYYFADSYLIGNLHQNPARFIPAREQFSKDNEAPGWLKWQVHHGRSAFELN